MYNFILQTARRSIFDENREFWVAVISKHPFLTRAFKKAMEWPLTPEEDKQRRQDEVDRTQPKFCKNCREQYVEAENKFNSCTYHDGFLFNSSLHPSQWREMKKDEVELALLKQGFDNRALTYICCLRKYGEVGCKKTKHNQPWEDEEEDYYDKLEELRKRAAAK